MESYIEGKNLRDVQNDIDLRNIPLERVGIKDLEWPIKVLDKERGHQQTVAKIEIAVDLKHYIRGIHMSRFIEIMNELEELKPKSLEEMLRKIKEKLQAERSYLKMSFPYFIYKSAPISKIESPNKIEAIIDAELFKVFNMIIGVKVPIHTLCPCSKEISDYSAHNQRAIAEIYVKSKSMIWFEDLVEIAEKNASSPIFALLKRPDEKYITEHAYDNPKFVEDVVRDIAIELEKNNSIEWYKIEVTSMESIHNHNAFACLEKGWLDHVIRNQ